VLVGISGAGKSTFGRAHFRLTEVIFSDFCHGVVADDENGRDTSSARRTAPVGLGERFLSARTGRVGRWS
jgi:predicted kinase